MDGIEVEADERQRRKASRSQERRKHEDRAPVASRQGGEARGLRGGRVGCSAAQRQQSEHCRQHRETGGEGDEHAAAGDQSQLCEAAEIRRQKGVEARCGSHGAQHEGAADADAGAPQCRVLLEAMGELLAVAQSQMDAEIDRQADEQHGERDRDQVQVAEREGGESRRPHQAHQQRRHGGHDQAPGAQADHEQRQHQAQ